MERRICIYPENAIEKYSPEFVQVVESASLTRSLLYSMHANSNTDEASPSLRFRLLRVYSSVVTSDFSYTDSDNTIFEQANLRYLSLEFHSQDAATRMVSLCSLLWNLQTLKVRGMYSLILPSKIWKMPLLIHVMLEIFALPDPPNGENNFALENLQTLSRIINFKVSEEVVKRIPNIKILELRYERDGLDHEEELTDFCLNNLGRLKKLESLSLIVDISDNCALERVGMALISFPYSLKKLSLYGTKLNWEELTIKIGSLPLLQFLRLYSDACVGPKWETQEGQFCNLRVLQIWYCTDLKYWDTDNTHFPCLEHLLFNSMDNLEEIPSSIGDIPTLKSIRLEYCNISADESVKRIKLEQEENGNEVLQVVIDPKEEEVDARTIQEMELMLRNNQQMIIQLDSDEEDQEDDESKFVFTLSQMKLCSEFVPTIPKNADDEAEEH